MELIKKYFPVKAVEKDVVSLVIAIVAYVVVGAIASLLMGLLANIPVVSILITIAGILVDLYCLAGIVLAVLDFLGVKF